MSWAFAGTARAKGWRIYPILLFVFGCLIPGFVFASGTPTEVVHRFVTKHPEAHVGVLAFDLDDNRFLMAYNPKDVFVPASVAKIFVTSALLSTLGTNYRFVTKVLTNGSLEIERGILHGDLILKGSGYPGLDDKDIQALAGVLVRSRGIRKIEGGVGVDASLFVLRKGIFMPMQMFLAMIGRILLGRWPTWAWSAHCRFSTTTSRYAFEGLRRWAVRPL